MLECAPCVGCRSSLRTFGSRLSPAAGRTCAPDEHDAIQTNRRQPRRFFVARRFLAFGRRPQGVIPMAPRQTPDDPLESTRSFALSERTSQTDDQRIRDVTPLPPPEHLIRFFPIADTPIEKLIGRTRATVRKIMQGEDDRLLVVIGPCSIHDPAAALDYARKLKAERARFADTLE